MKKSVRLIMKKHFLEILIILVFVIASCAKNNPLATDAGVLKSGLGKLLYSSSMLYQKAINFFYLISSCFRKNISIVIVRHQDERNAFTYRNVCLNASNQYRITVFAPAFINANFHSQRFSIIGNIYQDGRYPTPQTITEKNISTFYIIEPLFDFLKTNFGMIATNYNIFGHSGRGQFLHRFVLIIPNTRYKKAIAANFKRLLPADGVSNFHDEIMNYPTTSIHPKRYFDRQLYFTANALDNDRSDCPLRHNTIGDLQGLNFLDCANYFFSKCHSYAHNVHSEFNWQFHIVVNSNHKAAKMSNHAVHTLFS